MRGCWIGLSVMALMQALCFAAFGQEPSVSNDVVSDLTPSELEELVQQSVSQGYHEDFIDLVEMIYGPAFLSQGGVPFVEKIISQTSIDHQRVLDIGAGLGGPVLHLATNHPVDIVGLEPQTWLWKRAIENLNAKKDTLQGSVQFVLMEHPTSLKQFPDQSFDVVMSQETILHVPRQVKKTLFSEIYRVLKPGGKIVIMDWMHRDPHYSAQTRKMMEMDGIAYHLITSQEYEAVLSIVGFTDITSENISAETAGFSQGNIDKIQTIAPLIQEKYDDEVYEYCIESWGYQRDAFASGEFAAMIFRAQKPL